MKTARTRITATSKPAVGIKQADYVSALARGLEIIRLFSAETPRLSTSDAANLTGLSRAAARRFLLTLSELGYLRSSNDYFEPQPRLLELGYAYLSTWNFPQLVTPCLHQVVNSLQENCSLAVLDGTDVVYLARAEARRIVQTITISVGTRVPGPISALGRVLLAHQPRATVDELLTQRELKAATRHTITDPMLFREKLAGVRKQGYALVDGEFEEGLLSIAVPIFAQDGSVIAAINVGAPNSRATPELMLEKYLPVLQAAASDISRLIATSGKTVLRTTGALPYPVG